MSKPAQVDGRRALEEAAKREAAAFRPNTRPMLIALGVNGLIAALFLAVPYVRGQRLAERSLREFASFASCAIGGEPEATLGLSLPPAERSHFADKVLHEEPSWPKRCYAPLHALVPEQAIFLWPSVKGASADVSATAQLVERELATLESARAAGVRRIPERPLLAIAKLRAALTLLARAANVSESLDEPAVRFGEAAGVTAIEPTRLPIMAGETAAMDLWLRRGGIEALSLDQRGLSWLALDDGTIDRTRVKRSSLLRGTVRVAPQGEPSAAYGIFAMPPERCETDEHRCVRRATGVAPITHQALFEGDQERPLSPQWLAAHPAGRFDRSVRIDPLSIEVLALADEAGALEVRRFTRAIEGSNAPPEPQERAAPAEGEAAEAHDEDKPRPSSASNAWPLDHGGAPADLTFVPERSTLDLAEARANADAGIEARLLDPRTRAQLPLGTLAGSVPFITTCRDTGSARGLERAVLAYGSERELALTRVDGDAQPSVTTLARIALPVSKPLDGGDPGRDRVVVRCDGATSAAVALGDDGDLVAVQCEDTRCEQRTIDRGVERFAAVLARDARGAQLVLALSHARDPSTAITTWRLGSPPPATRVPCGCWDPAAGMCGAPALAADGAQVVLAARERADLRVIESLDAGASWHARPDMASATVTDLAAPMEQHRMRKGLDK